MKDSSCGKYFWNFFVLRVIGGVESSGVWSYWDWCFGKWGKVKCIKILFI